MDHFALPENELAVAQREGTLYRNFQGYSTHADCDLVAMGVTAIGMLADTYAQNVRTEAEYFERIDAGQLPVYRGVVLNADDNLRRAVISSLICHFRVDYPAINKSHGVDFKTYFAAELVRLNMMERDGLLQIDENCIVVTPAGRLLIRNICMVFDVYLIDARRDYSKVI